MAEAARAAGWSDGERSFEYRLLSPLFDHQGLIVSAAKDSAAPEQETMVTSARDSSGRKTATGTLRRA